MTIWRCSGTVVRVHDGDTLIADIELGELARLRCPLPAEPVEVDLGWHVRARFLSAGPDRVAVAGIRSAVRVNGLASPELGSTTNPNPAGVAARDYASSLLPPGAPIEIVSLRLLGAFDKYGRVLADVAFGPDGASFAQAMISAGHGVAWSGTGVQPV